jgi:hypothetical protein
MLVYQGRAQSRSAAKRCRIGAAKRRDGLKKFFTKSELDE